MSSISIIAFVMLVVRGQKSFLYFANGLPRSFAIGLGPVPIVMISDLSPHVRRMVIHFHDEEFHVRFKAATAISSIALSVNCKFTLIHVRK